jgi:hypothetical protein
MFVSTHGFGTRDPANPAVGGWFYPGSGANIGWDTDCINSISDENKENKEKINDALKSSLLEGTETSSTNPPRNPHGKISTHSFQQSSIPEHLYEKELHHPMIINVSVPHGSKSATIWRRILTLNVLPKIANFKPDLILVSVS